MIRNIFVLSSAEAKQFCPKNFGRCAMLRVTSQDHFEQENWGFPKLQYEKQFVHVMGWVFDDTVRPNEMFCMLESQTQSIHKFVDLVKNDCDTLIIHCDGGVSRSSAIAICIAKYIGRDEIAESIIYNPYFKPNIHVRKTLGRVMKVEPTEAELQELYEKLFKERQKHGIEYKREDLG